MEPWGRYKKRLSALPPKINNELAEFKRVTNKAHEHIKGKHIYPMVLRVVDVNLGLERGLISYQCSQRGSPHLYASTLDLLKIY